MTFFIENISIYFDNDITEWLIYGKYIKVNIDSQMLTISCLQIRVIDGFTWTVNIVMKKNE